MCAALVFAAFAVARADLLGHKLNAAGLRRLRTAVLTLDPPVPRRGLSFI
jgi:hypothetical protein